MKCNSLYPHTEHFYAVAGPNGTGTYLCTGVPVTTRPYDVWTDFHFEDISGRTGKSLLKHCPKESLPYIFPGSFVVLGDTEGNRAAGLIKKVDYDSGVIAFEMLNRGSFVPGLANEEGFKCTP